jgi:hypothetical protein
VLDPEELAVPGATPSMEERHLPRLILLNVDTERLVREPSTDSLEQAKSDALAKARNPGEA